MSYESLAWGTRIRSVEREYVVARFATHLLDRQAR